MIIDVHSHPILDSWLKAARTADPDGERPRGNGVQAPDRSSSLAIETMDANGIDAMVPTRSTNSDSTACA